MAIESLVKTREEITDSPRRHGRENHGILLCPVRPEFGRSTDFKYDKYDQGKDSLLMLSSVLC